MTTAYDASASMPDDLRPATRAEILSALTYGLRFDRRGKPIRRHSEMMAQFTAEALADMLDASNMVLTMKPPTPSVNVRTGSERKLT